MTVSPTARLTRLQRELDIGYSSRRRDYHSAAPPLIPVAGVSIGMERECQQSDSLADG